MIRIFKLVLLLVVSQVAFGQAPTNYTNINGRYRWIAGMFDSTFHIPKGTSPSLRTGGSTNPGALFYKTSDSSLYLYSGSQWLKQANASGYVPYTGATDTLDMGQFGVKTKFLQFDTSSRAISDRTMQWSNDNGTLQFGMTNGGTITQNIGLQQFARVKNVQGSQINKGQVVYLYGASGDRASVKLADNRQDSTSSKTLGIAVENIAINDVGLIGTFGTMSGFNLSAYNEGDVLYLDSIPGGLTKTKPQAPYHLVFIGVVERNNAGNGLLFTNPQNGYELEELHNVKITTPVRNNAILVYDSVARLWIDTTISQAGLAVTSVATNTGTGITGGTITTSGTLAIDTLLISTRAWRQKGVDSLATLFNTNVSGTTNYVSKFTGTNSIGNSRIFDNGTTVGIGTISPTGSGLEVYNDAVGGRLRLTRDAGTTRGALQFGRNNAGSFQESSRINATSDNAAATNGSMTFQTADGSGSLQINMTLESDGDVSVSNKLGVGTLTGDSALTVVNGARFQRGVRMSGLPTAVGTKAVRIDASGTLSIADTLTNGVSGSGTANYLSRFTGSTSLGNSGIYQYNANNYGLGTTNITASTQYTSFTLNTDSIGSFINLNKKDTNRLYLGVGGTEPKSYVLAGSNYPLVVGGIGALEFWVTGSIPKMYINDLGRVGIGTSSPTQKLQVNGRVKIDSIDNATTDTDRFLVSDGGVVKYRTGSEVLSDIGAAASTSISGTTNYIPKFTSSSAIGNSVIYESSSNIGIGTITPATKLDVAGIIRVTNGAYQIYENSVFRGGFYPYNGVLGSGTDYSPTLFSETSLYFTVNGSATKAMTLDASGNLGLGVTPSASADPAFQSRYGVFIGNDETNISNNAYFNAGWKYAQTGFFANRYYQDGYTGGHQWLIAPSGTAGNAITFSQAMTLNASGNLGLGVTPSAWGTGQKAIQFGSRGIISNNSAGTYSNFGNNAYFDGTNWVYLVTGTAGVLQMEGNNFYWQQAPSGTAGNAITFTQAMTLNASGNLGLGVTPSAWITSFKTMQISNRLALSGTAASVYLGNNWFVNTSGSNRYIESDFATLYGQDNGIHAWYTAPLGTAGNAISFTQAMTLDASGRLGIGVTNPTSLLHLYKSGATSQLTIEGAGASNPVLYLKNPSGYASYIQYNTAGSVGLSIYDVTANADRIFINSSGNVGIGTTNPDVLLHVKGTAETATVLRFSPTSSTTIYSQVVGINGDLKLAADPGNAEGSTSIKFDVDGSERMRITSGGYVGINEQTPNSYLHVKGSLRLPIVSKTATYTLTVDDFTVVFDAATAGANLTANLPDATTCGGRIYTIYSKNTSSYGTTVDGNGAQTINGSATYALTTCNIVSITIQSDGSNWIVISQAFGDTCY